MARPCTPKPGFQWLKRFRLCGGGDMSIQRVLMCRPRFFDIEYSINPWMDVGNRVDKERAAHQWEEARRLLDERGIQIFEIEPVPNLPDMTFTGDCGVTFGNCFIRSNYRHPERQPEAGHFEKWFEAHGYRVVTLPEGVWFEGLGDVVAWENDIVFGHGPRSSPESLEYVQRAVPDLRVRARVSLATDEFFHTGLAAALLDADTLLYFPDAFTADSRRALAASFARCIEVDERDATHHFVCNNIPLGREVILDGCSPELRDQLADHGFQTVTCDMSEFKKSGGSVRCLIVAI